MTTPPIREPKQERSRKTLGRLLEAAVTVIASDGLAGATIPRIAEAAGVAPASVYRRFSDKEALIRAAFLDVLERSGEANAARVPPVFHGRTLEWIGGVVARSLIHQYRSQPTFMRSLIRFIEDDDDAEFRQRAISLVVGNANVLVDAVAADFAGEIAHDDARRAVAFVTLVMANVIETRCLDEFSLWTEMLPLSDDEMVVELQRLFVAYLSRRH